MSRSFCYVNVCYVKDNNEQHMNRYYIWGINCFLGLISNIWWSNICWCPLPYIKSASEFSPWPEQVWPQIPQLFNYCYIEPYEPHFIGLDKLRATVFQFCFRRSKLLTYINSYFFQSVMYIFNISSYVGRQLLAMFVKNTNFTYRRKLEIIPNVVSILMANILE